MRDNTFLKSYSSLSETFVQRYLNILILFFPVTSFLLIPAIQGTTIPTVLIAILFGLIMFLQLGAKKLLMLKELYYFLVITSILSFASQLINVVNDVKLSNSLLLINEKDYLNTFYRISHLTQTLYIVVSFILFIIIKYFSDSSIIKYIYWALRLLCIYALYEFVYYQLTGQSGDFITNRSFGDGEKSASLFQTASIGSFNFMRIKGYTGEPSMFTFTIFPFWVLSFALKRRFDNYLLLVCLIFTASTTAYLSVILFLGFWFFYKKHYKLIIYFGLSVVILAIILQLDALKEVLDGIYDYVFGDKLSGNNSSEQRGGLFTNHIEYWSKLKITSQIFGIGFGYIRSTDFFSTLLLNTGIVGTLIFSAFTLKNLKLKILPNDLNYCYKSGLIIMYVIMLATVPEFSYPTLWIYLALGILLKEKENDKLYQDSIVTENSQSLRKSVIAYNT